MINYLREYGSGLISNGYRIIPIRRGCKAPIGITGWTQIEADLNQLGQWISAGFEGVGILTKNNPAIDIDILDEDVSREMVRKVQEQYPNSPIRVGKAPKTLLCFRTDVPFKKVRSNTYEDQFGDRHAVEILGDGQQYVAYAEHPDTLRPYTWFAPDSEQASPGIFEVASASLPVIHLEDARLVVEWFEEIAQGKVESEGWVRVQDGQGGSETESPEDEAFADDFSNLRPRLNLSPEQIRTALQYVSADEYDKWIRVGMALWHECEGSEQGFNWWHEWSQSSDSYTDERSLRIRWRGFRSRRRGRTITFATVLHWAREARMEDNPLGEFMDRFVYVADGDSVHDLSGFGHDKPLLLKEFKNMTANIITTIEAGAPTVRDPDRVVEKRIPVHTLWLTDPERKTAHGFEYAPDHDQILTDSEGKKFINTFHLPKFANPCNMIEVNGVMRMEEACCNKLLGIFFRHMEYIVPVEVEREWFYDWMAFNIQKPGQRCKVTPLLIATDHGTGRGWIVQLMNLLLGSWNSTKTKMGTLNGETGAGQFQDFLNHSLLCCIEEVKDGDKRYGITDTIRDYLTENTLEINLKYGAKTTKRVYTNFFWMSNHADAIVLTEEDRRINVFRTEDKPKGHEYYERLYGWLECSGSSASSGTTPENDTASEPDSESGNTNNNSDRGDPDSFSSFFEGSEAEDNKFFDRGGSKVSAGVACLWHWLNQRDITGFNRYRSMTNRSRRDMIESNMSELERVFWNVASMPPHPVMTLQEIQDHIMSGGGTEQDFQNGDGEDFLTFSGKERGQIRRLVQQHLQKQEQVKITKKVVKEAGDQVTTEGDQVTTFWVRGWSFNRGEKYTKAEIRQMYENR